MGEEEEGEGLAGLDLALLLDGMVRDAGWRRVGDSRAVDESRCNERI